MDIAVDGRVFEDGAGGRVAFTLNVMQRIKEAKFWVLHQKEIGVELPKNCVKVRMEMAGKWKTDQVIIPKVLVRLGNPTFWEPANMGVPFFAKSKVLLTVHDVIPVSMKDYFKESRFALAAKILYKARVQIGLWKADRVTTDSPASKNDLKKHFWVSERKVSVVAPGVVRKKIKNEEATLKKFHLKKGEFILNNGGIDRRKNLERLIEAYGRLKPRQKLVITGEDTGLRAKLPDVNNVIFTGKITDKEVQALVRNASCIAYPTLAEGFGLPLLEAMANGVPVVASNIPVLKWIGKDVPIYVDPYSVESIAKGIKKGLGKRDLKKIKLGIERAEEFSWERTAEEVYKQFLLV